MTTPIAYRRGYRYQLAEDYYFRLHEFSGWSDPVEADWYRIIDGGVEVNRGYAWDGPSGPAIDTLTFMRASLIHDVLYQAMRERRLPHYWRHRADRIMRRIAHEDGMSWPRRQWTFWAVRTFAKDAASPDRVRPILYAPREAR